MTLQRENRSAEEIVFYDFSPPPSVFREEVLRGLASPRKELPSKYFYDERGSWLFERLAETDTFYPAHAEAEILRTHGDRIGSLSGADCLFIECGLGMRTESLLSRLKRPAAYVAIDLSRRKLEETVDAVLIDRPGLEVVPVCADFMDFFALPPTRAVNACKTASMTSVLAAWNASSRETVDLLSKAAKLCAPRGGLLMGVDLKKDRRIVERAYDDPDGAADAFDLNLLVRLNRELGADFDPAAFRHEAEYDEATCRVEMRLVSRRRQTVTVGDAAVTLAKEERIVTGAHRLYGPDEFRALADTAGWDVEAHWTDARGWFALYFLRTAG